MPPEPPDAAGVDPPPKRPLPPVELGWLAGVVEGNIPPGLGVAVAPWPPKREGEPVAGAAEFPAVEPNENDGVPPLGFPKSPPEAGAVVDGLLWLFEEGVEPVFPKLNDMAARLRRSGRGRALECKGWARDARLRRYRSPSGWQTEFREDAVAARGFARAPSKTAVICTVLLLTEGVMMDLCLMSEVVGWNLN